MPRGVRATNRRAAYWVDTFPERFGHRGCAIPHSIFPVRAPIESGTEGLDAEDRRAFAAAVDFARRLGRGHAVYRMGDRRIVVRWVQVRAEVAT